MEEAREKFSTIKSANQDMLDYFNRAFLEQLEDIQNVKAQIFEIDIKMDELDKTKDVYAFKTNSRKSVFSPIISDGADTARSKIIQEQMNDLVSIKDSLNIKLRTMEIQLNKLRRYLETLNEASDALASFEPKYSHPDVEDSEDYGFTFLNDDASEDISSHGHNILMQDAFDRALIQTLMEKNVKTGLESMSNRLQMISYLLGTDVPRAKLTLQEMLNSTKQMIDSVDDIENKLVFNVDTSKPIQEQLQDYLSQFKKANPQFSIDASVEMSDPDASYLPVFPINLLKLLHIFMDNIVQHANANNITLKVAITPNVMEVILQDDGVGLGEDFLQDAPWYSSIHKAKEILYMLCGKLEMNGDLMSGTQVKFSFPTQY